MTKKRKVAAKDAFSRHGLALVTAWKSLNRCAVEAFTLCHSILNRRWKNRRERGSFLKTLTIRSLQNSAYFTYFERQQTYFLISED